MARSALVVGSVPLLVEVPTLHPLLDQLHDQVDGPKEGPPDLGFFVPVGDVVEEWRN